MRKNLSVLLLLLPILLFQTRPAQGQTVTVSATIETAPSTCTLSISSSTVSFGTLGRAGTSSGGTAAIDPTAATVAAGFTVSGGVSKASGSPSWGEGSFRAQNAPNTQVITFTVPSISSLALAGDATKIISASLSTASSATQSGTYTSGMGSIPIGSLGEGTDVTRYFRIGASLTGIGTNTDTGTYSRTTSAFGSNVNGSCA
ncbi:MAG: hypothetical protein OXG94_09785 [Bacteroidetes bacterium]|nr:hypothetical protein [Bacteroidota bacterium]